MRIHSCEVCGGAALESVLDLGLHPLCDDLIAVGDSRVCLKYPIEILLCRQCLTAHQAFQVPKETLFPRSYHYRSRFTADVIQGMKELVASCESVVGGVAGATVVDVGCNDGSLLELFGARGARTLIGIEPTGACDDAAAKGLVTFNQYLSEPLAAEVVALHGTPAFVTMTNVFAHIERLPEVIAALKRLAGPRTVFVIENHYLGAVLERDQFDTFYHEHPRSYSYTSFATIARSAGLAVLHVAFPSRYGGNIRVFLGQAAADRPETIDDPAIRAREASFAGAFDTMRAHVSRWRERKGRVLADLVRQHGPLRAKAFPGRAAILVKLLGLDTNTISAVYEKPGSLKIGHYLPGTRIAIHSDDELFAQTDASPIVNLAWHIPAEIRSYLEANGVKAPIVDVVERQDFSAP